MPVTKSAKKKLRQDKKRTLENRKAKNLLRDAIKKGRKNPSEKNIIQATKLIDKAVKKYIIHKNKAARLKSSLSKLISKKGQATISPKKPVKKSKK
ncbi:MAG: 30S ribosomal protein S20 [Candidatus Levybacteria bacterium]|nr:30S ribosomal protein S20 [Candidatus Levybacteria bacterium]